MSSDERLAEIWARLTRALGVIDDAELRPLREAAEQGLVAYAQAFLTAVGANPMLSKALPFVLYETLGPTLPDGLAGAAALWGLAQKAAMTYPEAVRRAGHIDKLLPATTRAAMTKLTGEAAPN